MDTPQKQPEKLCVYTCRAPATLRPEAARLAEDLSRDLAGVVGGRITAGQALLLACRFLRRSREAGEVSLHGLLARQRLTAEGE